MKGFVSGINRELSGYDSCILQKTLEQIRIKNSSELENSTIQISLCKSLKSLHWIIFFFFFDGSAGTPPPKTIYLASLEAVSWNSRKHKILQAK